MATATKDGLRDHRHLVLDKHTIEFGHYEGIYQHIHAKAELSWQEHKTAALVVETLQQLSPDLEIKRGIRCETGLLAILRNGPGRTVLLRADMDALPVKEMTGLDYACTREMKDIDGKIQPVMHACGHDMHVAALLAAANMLVASREHWTVMIPRKLSGACAMIDAGLYTTHQCPIPDIVLGQHVFPVPAGRIVVKSGLVMAGTDGMVVKVYGRGAHGSMPHLAVDPVLLARELAVVTVGAISAGSAENIISDEAVLKVNTRSVSLKWRQTILDSIRRIVRAECAAANSPKDPMFEPTGTAPPLVNNESVTAQLMDSFSCHFGDQYETSNDVTPASEDFGELAIAVNRPYCFWGLGGHDLADWDQRVKEGGVSSIPGNHSPFYAPVIQPTLKAGAEALAVGALTFLSK
ncbi:hypothetical protein BX600DRAFT_485880 [Xylariales sp. PMI_506]|nr:hypothetical protein BX600DRAFT_485880 [Xylariales sp. PMI_506]